MRTFVLLLVLCSGAIAQAAAPSWLHPTDAEFLTAAATGYSLKRAKVPYHTIEVGVFGSGVGQSLLILSPLNCAITMGTEAAKHLEPMPSIDDIKALCDGEVEVEYEINMDPLRFDFAVAFVHGTTTLRSSNSVIDQEPSVVRGFLGVHYEYINTFWFKPDTAWPDQAEIEYSNGASVSKAKVDFSRFVSDETIHRALSSK